MSLYQLKIWKEKCLVMYIFVNSDIAIVFASLDSVLIRIASASGYDKEIELILCCDYTIPVYPHFCPPSITVSEWHSVRKTSHGNFCNLEHLRWLPSVNSLFETCNSAWVCLSADCSAAGDPATLY